MKRIPMMENVNRIRAAEIETFWTDIMTERTTQTGRKTDRVTDRDRDLELENVIRYLVLGLQNKTLVWFLCFVFCHSFQHNSRIFGGDMELFNPLLRRFTLM